MNNKIVLAFGAHPDDVEFGCGGTLILLKELGYDVTIVDLTKGEKSKFGADRRLNEAEEARKIMGVKREFLNLGDKKISLSEEHKKEVKEIIKKYDPEIVFAPYFIDKHTDHINTAKLVSQFVSTIHYFISNVEKENLGVDISRVYSKKIEALKAHITQIRPGDIEWADERHKIYGKKLGVRYGELFYSEGKFSLPSIFKEI